MVDHCTQHEQNPFTYLRYITTNILNLWNNEHKLYIMEQSQGIVYMHEVLIVVDYCAKYEEKQSFLLWDITNAQNVWKSDNNFFTEPNAIL